MKIYGEAGRIARSKIPGWGSLPDDQKESALRGMPGFSQHADGTWDYADTASSPAENPTLSGAAAVDPGGPMSPFEQFLLESRKSPEAGRTFAEAAGATNLPPASGEPRKYQPGNDPAGQAAHQTGGFASLLENAAARSTASPTFQQGGRTFDVTGSVLPGTLNGQQPGAFADTFQRASNVNPDGTTRGSNVGFDPGDPTQNPPPAPPPTAPPPTAPPPVTAPRGPR